MAQEDLITLSINQSVTINIYNENFTKYTDGWHSLYEYTTASTYPSLTGNGYQSITLFNNWYWKNARMVHIPYTGGTYEDYIWPFDVGEYSGIITGHTYKVSFDIKDNTDYSESIYIGIYDSLITGVTYDGRYVQYITPTSYIYYPIVVVPTSGFSGSFSNLIIEDVTPITKTLDLVDSNSFAMNFQILSDLTTKGGTYSFNFDLVGDGNNLIQLNDIISPDYWFDSTVSANIDQYVFYNKSIYGGIQIKNFPIIYGQLVLQQGVNDNGNKRITCFFTNELKSFADQIGDKLIVGNDLDDNGVQSYDINFSEYNHIFNLSNIYMSNDTINNSSLNGGQRTFPFNFYNDAKGFYYGFIDLDGPNSINLIETNKALIQNIRPCIYVKELWDKIWDRTDYTYDSDFIDSDYFKSIGVPMTFDLTTQDSRNINGSADQEFKVGLSQDFTGCTITIPAHTGYKFFETYKTSPLDLTGGTILYQDLFVNNEVVYDTLIGPIDSPNWYVTTSGKYDISFLIGYNLYITSPVSQLLLDFDITIYSYIYKEHAGQSYILSSNYLKTQPRNLYFPTGTTFFSTDQFLLNEIDGQELVNGDKIYCKIGLGVFNVSNRNTNYTFTLDIKQDKSLFYNKFTPTNFFEYGTKVNMQKCLPPSYGQMDFITDMINTFNLVAQPVIGTNIMEIEPWDQFFNISNKNDFVIWRGIDSNGVAINKIDESGSITTESIPDLLYQEVYLHNQDDSNDSNLDKYSKKYNRVFGSRTIENPYITDSIKEITNNFSPTVLNNFGSINWKVAQMYNKDKQPQNLNLPADENYNKRLLFRNKLSGTTIQGIGDLFVYGNYQGDIGYATGATNSFTTSLGTKTFQVTDSTGFQGGESILIVANDDPTQIMYSSGITSWNCYKDLNHNCILNSDGTINGTLIVNITEIDTAGNPPGTFTGWTLTSICNTTFGPNGRNKYQPYIGPLYNPYSPPETPTYDLNFGLPNYTLTDNAVTNNNIFNTYWKNKILTYIDPNSKYITMKVWLTLQDISNLDFRKKILIDNNLYILNKITGWNPNKSCKVDLIKLSDYSAYFSDDQNNWKYNTIRNNTIRTESKMAIELLPISSVQITSGITGEYIDNRNYYPINFTGLISNSQGNIINAASGTFINSNDNIINSDNAYLFNSSNNYIESGLTSIFLYEITGQTIINNTGNNQSGTSGSSGTSGTSGYSGTAGTAGTSGISPIINVVTDYPDGHLIYKSGTTIGESSNFQYLDNGSNSQFITTGLQFNSDYIYFLISPTGGISNAASFYNITGSNGNYSFSLVDADAPNQVFLLATSGISLSANPGCYDNNISGLTLSSNDVRIGWVCTSISPFTTGLTSISLGDVNGSFYGIPETAGMKTIINLGAFQKDRINFIAGNSATAPSTVVAGLVTNRYGGGTNFLGDPVGWIDIQVNGVARKIPYY